MSTATESLTDRDHRIDSVIYEFLSAIDRGESADPAEWVTRHPELAPDLEEHFRDLDGAGTARDPSRRLHPARKAGQGRRGDGLPCPAQA